MKGRIGILGAGISGIGAALLAKAKGYDVWVSDLGEIKEDRKHTLREHHIPFEEKGHQIEKLLTCEVIVRVRVFE
jgi:UDP-N-acetylmuramoylalanine--D-glutamate ligase